MDDMRAFERQIAGIVQGVAGPERQVDALAVARRTTAQSPKWRLQSMFSATKFVVAGVIVALFGGFLLAGVLTQRSGEQMPAVGASASASAQAEATAEPTAEVEAAITTTRSDILPGVDLVTEEVGPGVYRVVSDGVRELTVASDASPESRAVAADGGIWLFHTDVLFRLGEEQMHAPQDPSPNFVDVAIDDEGMPRVVARDATSEAWRSTREAPTGVAAYDIGSDGTVWARLDPMGVTDPMARLDENGWTIFTMEDGLPALSSVAPWRGFPPIVVAHDGSVWTAPNDCGNGVGHFDGTTWTSYLEDLDVCVTSLDIAPEGAVWLQAWHLDEPDIAIIDTYVITPEAVAATESVAVEPAEEAEPTDTTTTRDLLPGVDLVTEEVEPGVFRVVSDGVRELESEPTIDRVGPMQLIGPHHSIAAGLDGSVWLFGPEAFFRLGDDDRHGWPNDDPRPALDDLEVGLDGVVWRVSTVDLGPLMSFDGRTWTSRRDRAVGVEVQSDGTVWAAWLNDNDRAKVGRFEGDGWDALPGSVRSAFAGYPGWQPLAVALAPGDDVWLSNLFEMQRFVEGGWQSSDPPGGLGVRVDVAPGGTAWAMGMPRPDGYLPSRALARLDAGGWAVFYDTLHQAGMREGAGMLMAGMDESLWISPFDSLQTSVCEGVSNFDGVTLRRYLSDHCVYAMDVAPDGSVWIQAGEWPEGSDQSEAGPIRTYVITPEAVAATE